MEISESIGGVVTMVSESLSDACRFSLSDAGSNQHSPAYALPAHKIPYPTEAIIHINP